MHKSFRHITAAAFAGALAIGIAAVPSSDVLAASHAKAGDKKEMKDDKMMKDKKMSDDKMMKDKKMADDKMMKDKKMSDDKMMKDKK